MSLTEAVLAVADGMEEAGNEIEAPTTKVLLKSFARELRTAVKAAASDKPTREFVPGAFNEQDPFLKKDREERAQRLLKVQESVTERMVEAIDGPVLEDADSLIISIKSDTPVGAFMFLGPDKNHVYQLGTDGKLHYNAKETERVATIRNGQVVAT